MTTLRHRWQLGPPSYPSIMPVMTWALLFLIGCGEAKREPSASSISTEEALERTTEKGPVKLVVRVSPREPRLSDLVEMEILVTAQPGVEIKPPAFGQAVGDFLVRDYSERTPQSSARKTDDAPTRRFLYKLEPSSAGRHLIRSMAIEFVDQRPTSEQKGVTTLIESEPIEVNVTSELGDQVPNLADLTPMLPPRPLTQSSPWLWPVLAVVLGLIGLSIFWLRRRRTTLDMKIPSKTPEEIAHAALTALLAENLPAQGLHKEFYLRLTNIVRHFIEGTTGLRAPEQTTEEFLHAIGSRDVFSPDRSVRLKEFLEAADMVKYAGQQPDGDQIELAIARALYFVAFQPQVSAQLISELSPT